jgi:hypothetical protein
LQGRQTGSCMRNDAWLAASVGTTTTHAACLCKWHTPLSRSQDSGSQDWPVATTIDAGTSAQPVAQWPLSPRRQKDKTGFSCLGLLRPAPLINLPFPSCFCRCCAAALLQLSGLLPSGRETFPGGVDDSRQSVCASEWASGHIRRVNRCRGSGGTPPGSASP